MRFYVAWLNDQGGLNGPVDWDTYFDDYVPVVGDSILMHWQDDGSVTADKVVERYVTYAPGDEPVWLIVLEHHEIAPDRAEFARRVDEDFAKGQASAQAELNATIGDLSRSPRRR